jgi:hypothetical protein
MRKPEWLAFKRPSRLRVPSLARFLKAVRPCRRPSVGASLLPAHAFAVKRNLFLTISFYRFAVVARGSMVWSRKLAKPIYLNDGRTIGTLAAARDLMLSLPSRSLTNAHWQDTAEILLESARNGRIDPLRDAGAQVSRALQAEGLI